MTSNVPEITRVWYCAEGTILQVQLYQTQFLLYSSPSSNKHTWGSLSSLAGFKMSLDPLVYRTPVSLLWPLLSHNTDLACHKTQSTSTQRNRHKENYRQIRNPSVWELGVAGNPGKAIKGCAHIKRPPNKTNTEPTFNANKQGFI